MRLPKNKGRFVASFIAAISVIFVISTVEQAYSQSQNKKEVLKEDSFNRPELSRPIKPEVPGVNRYQENKVFLEYADSLYKVRSRDTIEKQILKGDVKFRQAGMWMFCDSAYYYPEINSLDAFSNVRMEQGDTLFVYADKLFYNGDARMAYLKNGPSRNKVTMINKDVTLTTDSLDYNLGLDLGWYSRWGTIDDKVNTLTSLYGEYSPATKKAEFYTDVVLVNNKDGFTMLTDTLHYNTETHIAEIDSKTEIRGANDTIITSLATYYTDTGNADLLSRSLIIHRDSTGNVTTLEGDSIIYDNATRISRVFMFNDPYKHSYPMVLTDTAQKTTLIGGFGIYNDSTKEALATIYPLLMEYSQGDTIFLRADTIKTYIVREKIPKKRWFIKTESGYPEYDSVPIVKIDSLGWWFDTIFFSGRIPWIDYQEKMILKHRPEPKNQGQKRELKEKKIDQDTTTKVEEQNIENEDIVVDNESSLILIGDSIKSKEDEGVFQTQIETLDSINSINSRDSVDINVDSIPIFPDSLKLMSPLLPETVDSLSVSEEIEFPEPTEIYDSIPYEYHVALAYHRGRFFKKDMQGVADSLVFVEKDSMLYMFRKPIIWSGERQVTGNRIDVHFNDSTADWAFLPESGLISEYVDEDFYNQISGKEITAYFEDQGLRKMSVSGNVETIFLPQEADSTYNRMVSAESSYLELDLKDNKMDRLKMWPEVSGTVTPIFLVKRSQQYLQKFKWWGFLRPEREWYGDQIRWADNLGEIPDELEQYFLSPSDFGEPKSFPSKRPAPSISITPSYDMGESMDTISSDVPFDEKIEMKEPLTLPEIEEEDSEMNEEKNSIEEFSNEIWQAIEEEKKEEEQEEEQQEEEAEEENE